LTERSGSRALRRSGKKNSVGSNFTLRGGEAYSISNLVVTDNAATWDRLFKGVAHTCVGTGAEAVVEYGKSVMWTLPPITCD
jgi:hypothetical protein